ncbi:MAG: Uma2 family endonuclease [Acidobacteriota bacterium]|nr:Uma2 family endonuclease [Acidobacteriota bacterium]
MAVLTLENPVATTEELVEKLYRTKGKAEIVKGEVVEFMATGCEPGIAAGNIFFSLKIYQRQTKQGFAVGDNVGFLVNLPNRKSFSPDAAFHVGAKTGMKFLEGAPIFAVEVRSENDYGEKAEKEIAQKRRDYFAAGTEVVWDVDLLGENIVKSYHRDKPNEPQIFRRGEIADAEPALRDWKMAVDELFE